MAPVGLACRGVRCAAKLLGLAGTKHTALRGQETSDLNATEAGDDTGRHAEDGDELGVPRRGQSIGRYVVIDRVGAGAMGLVFAAYDPDLDRRVAIKLLRRRGGDDDARMTREAQAVAKVVHPNVVGVHDVGLWCERLFVAMEFVEGASLAAWLSAQPRSFAAILEVFGQAGRGLAAAHRAGIVHRDFKPDNVLVGGDGRVRVADFGLARATGATDSAGDPALAPAEPLNSGPLSLHLTAPGSMVGTPAYMSPEQHRGESCTPASDQFSFCVALWEALFDARPFAGDSLAALAVSVLEGRVQAHGNPRPVPRAVREALLRGLAVEPASRHPSMDALLSGLQHSLRARRRWWLAAALIAGGTATGFAFAQWSVPSAARACDERSSPIAAVWNEGAAGSLRAAFVATEQPWAASTASTVSQRLDDYAARWTGQWLPLCRAQRDAPDVSSPEQDNRLECLLDRQREVAAVVELLSAADALTATDAFDVLGVVRDVERCADDEALRQRASPPPKDKLLDVGAIRDELATASALHRVGSTEPADSMLADLRERAAAVGWRHVELEVEAEQLGWSRGASLTPAELAQLREAFNASLELDDPGLASRFALEIGWEIGYRKQEYAEGLAWVATGEALRKRAGGDWLLGVSALNNGAVIHTFTGEHVRAAAMFREAIALAEAHDDMGTRALQLRSNLGAYHASLRDYDLAVDELTAAVAGYREQFGELHPRVADIQCNLGTTLVRLGRLTDALVHFDAVERILAAAKGPPPSIEGQLDSGVTELAMLRGQFDVAASRMRKHIERSLARAIPPDQVTMLRIWLVRILLRQPEGHRAEVEAELEHIDRALVTAKSSHLAGFATGLSAAHALAYLSPAQLLEPGARLAEALRQGQEWKVWEQYLATMLLTEIAVRRGETETAKRWLEAAGSLDLTLAPERDEELDTLIRLARAQLEVDPTSPRVRRWLEVVRPRLENLEGGDAMRRAEVAGLLAG